MILADKIMELRKKNGWSQEELAEKLGVTRQAVSKWEGAQSAPDVQRILDMSRIFGVSTDYLLKDELDDLGELPAESDIGDGERRIIDMELASEFIAFRRHWAPRVAAAVFLCIISPVVLMMLGAFSESGLFSITAELATGLGLIVLLLLVAGAVSIFIPYGMKNQKYEFLETADIETAYGVSGMAREQKNRDAETYARRNILGTVLCILSVVPIFAGMFVKNQLLVMLSVCILLVVVGCGVVLFVTAGMNRGAVDMLLQEGDYSPDKKRRNRQSGNVAGIYWLLMTAVYLAYSFYTMRWDRSWIIWPVAGVLFPVVVIAASALRDKNK